MYYITMLRKYFENINTFSKKIAFKWYFSICLSFCKLGKNPHSYLKIGVACDLLSKLYTPRIYSFFNVQFTLRIGKSL